MNKRVFSLIAYGIGIPSLLLVLTASVPQIETSASGRQTPIASSLKQKRVISLQAQILQPIQKQTAPTILPIITRANLTEEHRTMTQHVLTTLPPQCKTYLQNFHVLYRDAKQRGLGGKTTIILDGTVPRTEFLALLVHECGHVTHGNMTGSPLSGTSTFKDGRDPFFRNSPAAAFFAISWETESVLRSNTQKNDFVSGYARSDAFEDFAETFTTYVLHRELLEARALDNFAIAAKLAWMETNVPLPKNAIAKSTATIGTTIPWDATKLGIEY